VRTTWRAGIGAGYAMVCAGVTVIALREYGNLQLAGGIYVSVAQGVICFLLLGELPLWVHWVRTTDRLRLCVYAMLNVSVAVGVVAAATDLFNLSAGWSFLGDSPINVVWTSLLFPLAAAWFLVVPSYFYRLVSILIISARVARLLNKGSKGDLHALDRASVILGKALRGPSDFMTAMLRTVRSTLLLRRTFLTGGTAGIEEAIRELNQARAGLRPGMMLYQSMRFLILERLASTSLFRHLVTNALSPLDDTVETCERLLAGRMPLFDRLVGGVDVKSLLCKAYLWRYNVAGKSEDMNAALSLIQSLPKRAVREVRFLLCVIEFESFTDAATDPEAMKVALDALATSFSEISDLLPESQADRFRILALAFRAVAFDDPQEFERATGVVAQSTRSLDSADLDCAWLLQALGGLMETRHEMRQEHQGAAGTDLDQALHAYRIAAEAVQSPAADRLEAAAAAGSLAMANGDAGGALADFERAVRLLPWAAPLGLPPTDLEHLLASWPELVADSAAAALAAGQPTRAVELLEAGRAVIWQHLARIRTEFTRRQGVPTELGSRLDAIAAELGRPSPYASDRPAVQVLLDSLAGPERYRRVERRLALAGEFARLIEQAGLGEVFEPPSFAELREAAVDGPVVIVNISRFRCDALIVEHSGEPQLVPLLDLSHDEVRQRAEDFLAAWDLRDVDDDVARVNRFQVTRATAAWLWARIAEPILDALGLAESRRELPRIWWCPTGPLTALPLHAAASADGPAVMDRVVSSYTPTLRALIEARQRIGTGNSVARPLVVGIRDLPGWAPLKQVDAEMEVLTSHFPHRDLLEERAATVAAVTDRLPEATVAHFSCHGDRTGIRLWDGPLGPHVLARVHLRNPELAFLSACHTAMPDARIFDEIIHPAAILHLNGFRHVVATLWTIDDGEAPRVADEFYRLLLSQPKPTLSGVAQALHATVAALRASDPEAVVVWAPYIHIGP
jgi:hypothetical protein